MDVNSGDKVSGGDLKRVSHYTRLSWAARRESGDVSDLQRRSVGDVFSPLISHFWPTVESS